MRAGVLLLGLLALTAGCSATRYPGTGRSLGTCDYCIIQEAYGYEGEAASILETSFIVLPDDDPRLRLASIREKACEVVVNWNRGFWTTTGWVEVTDHETGADVFLVQTRRGMLWMGARGDVMESLREVAAARAEGPPLPDERERLAVDDVPAEEALDASSPVIRRLSELKDLYERGLIRRHEYDRKRRAILESL